jgi:hypothetical protein
MVSSAGLVAGKAGRVTTVTARSGYDPFYPLRGARGGGEAGAGGYYLSAARAGEEPGEWFGDGLAALGLHDRQLVETETYKTVYCKQQNPLTGEHLGRMRRERTYEQHLEGLLGREPHATAERRLELEREAHRQARPLPVYTDFTVSFQKSISVFHASIRENARQARAAGDMEGADWWDGQERRLTAILQEANRQVLAYVQEWAGFTRTGSHARRIRGEETGRWEEAGLVGTRWMQGTSRDGDPQDHIHNVLSLKCLTERDPRWLAPDTMALRAQLPALAAIADAYAECELTRQFGVEWLPRADGAGNEIRGISGAQRDKYSTRTQAIKKATPRAVAAWRAKYGREPNSRELLHIQQAVTLATRKGKDDAQIDWDELARKWDETLGGQLAQIARDVIGEPRSVPAPALTDAQAAMVARMALGAVQEKHSTWTRADLMRQVGLAMPTWTRGMDPRAAVDLVQSTTDRALASEFEPVVDLSPPQWPLLPAALVRDLDGRSVYSRPGSARYATQRQLTREEKLVAQARRRAAPHLSEEDAAGLLGADLSALRATLHSTAQDAGSAQTLSGLRLDQATTLYHVLTSPRTAEVLTGPAGSGKTRTLAQAARAWHQAGMGDVIGITTAQSAAAELAAAGVGLTMNSAKFLGHVPGQRGKLGVRARLAPGSLILIDEGSMMSLADLADIVDHASRHGHKVIVGGDQEQLAAVEGGGAMMLLAGENGYVQLAHPVRFAERWEREASLGLRRGEADAIAAYADHGRIRGDAPQQAMEAARRMYVAYYLQGQDAEVICQSNELAREMARRIRDDLVHLGIAGGGREVRLSHGQRAGVGDLVVCRENDQGVTAGEPERTLHNHDVMVIDAIAEDGTLTVRRAVDAGRRGERAWSAPFTWRSYGSADLGYAATGHVTQGRTLGVGIPVVTGAEDRQWLYPAMTRGRLGNYAHVFTRQGTAPDPVAGTRPAPELARQRHLDAERQGIPDPGGDQLPDQRDAEAVLADVLATDGAEESATRARQRMLADADHLGRLAAVWDGETRGLRIAWYKQAFAAVLPPGWHQDLDSAHATWLWRTMRGAELAGLDPGEVARAAVAQRPLDGARNAAAVLDARIRRAAGPMISSGPRTWASQVPPAGDAERQRFLEELARAMDERKERIGEHAARTSAQWAVNALGPVPPDPLHWLEWERRASRIGAYREMFGWEHEREPIGPEPSGDDPDRRAAWRDAFAAMLRVDGIDLRGAAEGSLWKMRATYAAETAWAPPHVGRELRAVREAAVSSALSATRADAEAAAARQRGDAGAAGRHESRAASYRAAGKWYEHRAELDEKLMQDRAAWEQLTAGPRHLALAADTELRRRHPGQPIEPVRSAEPEEQAQPPVGGWLDPQATAQHEEQARAAREAFAEKVQERQAMLVPDEDPDYEPLGPAWPEAAPWERDAILQPPPPQMPAASGIAREAEREAGS